jgi:hypothetical protein
MGGAAISANRTAPSLRTLSVSKTMAPSSVAALGEEMPQSPKAVAATMAATSLHSGFFIVVVLPFCALTDHRDKRLAFFDDIRGELRCAAAADVLRRVDRSGRDEQDQLRDPAQCRRR